MSEQEPLLSATRERFSDLMPKLTAEAGRPVPDLDSIERALRDGSHARGAMGLKAVLKDLDRQLPPPACETCGKAMARHRHKGRMIVTRLGPVTFERVYCYCRACNPWSLSTGPCAGA